MKTASERLGDMIADMARRGELTHLSVAATDEGFKATYAPASAFGTSTATEADPCAAMIAAMEGIKVKRRAVSKPGFTEPAPASEEALEFG